MTKKRPAVLTAIALFACVISASAVPGLAIGDAETSGKSSARGPDESFGVRGIASTRFTASPENRLFGTGVAGTSRGQVVLGVMNPGKAGSVIRYTSKGKTDRAFGKRGTADLRLKNGQLNPRDVLVDGRDRIVVIGEGFPRGSGKYGAAIARLRPDGSPDPSFSADGFNLPKEFKGMTPTEAVFARKGKIVMVGQVGGIPADEVIVARFLPNGSLDESFTGDGYSLIEVSPAQALQSIAIDTEDRIVIGAGGGTDYATYQLIRLRPNGGLDPSFGEGGRALPNEINGGEAEGLGDITVDRRGRILAASESSHGYVVRFKPNGQIDRGFGNDGRKKLAWVQPSSISVDLKGRPVVVGSTESPGGGKIVRLSPDGRGYLPYSVEVLTNLQDHFIDSKNRIIAGGSGKKTVGAIRMLNP